MVSYGRCKVNPAYWACIHCICFHLLKSTRIMWFLISFYSRSYAEDVTSVTSGASQGPHSFNLVFVCVFVCVTPGAICIWRQKSIGCYKFFNSPFFQAYPGIRTRTIALHAFPHTLRIHTHSSKLLYVIILRLKALFEYCVQLYVASCVWWYGMVRETVSYYPRSYLSRTYPLPYRAIKDGWPQCIFK